MVQCGIWRSACWAVVVCGWLGTVWDHLPLGWVGGMCAHCSSAGCVGCLLGRERHSVSSGCVFFLVWWVFGVPAVCMVLVLQVVSHISCFIIHQLEYRPKFQACPLFLCKCVLFLAQLGSLASLLFFNCSGFAPDSTHIRSSLYFGDV